MFLWPCLISKEALKRISRGVGRIVVVTVRMIGSREPIGTGTTSCGKHLCFKSAINRRLLIAQSALATTLAVERRGRGSWGQVNQHRNVDVQVHSGIRNRRTAGVGDADKSWQPIWW